MLTLLLTALAVTSGLAGSGSQEEGASLTWTGGHTTGEGGKDSQMEPITVVIDGYTHNSTLTSGDSVPLGTQIILVCRVVGLPYGTPLNYTWTCQNGDCELVRFDRKIYMKYMLAINTTDITYGGTYTCQVTATGGREATGSFTLTVTGGRVVYSEGRLIPHEFPITDLQQISGPDGIGRITCTVSSGIVRLLRDGGEVESEGKLETAITVRGNLQNRAMYCISSDTNNFYLYLTPFISVSPPEVTITGVTSSQVEYETTGHGNATRVIAGYEVTRFGVTMIGQYVNTGRGSRVTISPAVPGAQYRITAWAFGDGGRSATPAVVDATTGEAVASLARSLTVTRVYQDGVELNWLPPTEPNGEVRYVVEYKREDSGNWTSVSTTSDSTHYNLTGLHSGTSYTIRVVAVNSAGRLLNNIPPTHTRTTGGEAVIIVNVTVAFLILLVLLTVVVIFGVVLGRKELERKRGSPRRMGPSHEKSQTSSPSQEREATDEEGEDTNNHVYDFVYVASCNERGEPLYQELDDSSKGYTNGFFSQSGRRELPGAGPEGPRGGAPLPEDPHQQGEGGMWKQ